ncbi:hypothetical protein I302_102386 [Kwoniella bestiolae CBS 10118]|uniref:Uncharacterized protein n=1 Tax=Kwoniella bestiolae CBS 10118 TaxID=1296100 RepID=A0A1B9GEV6_9TREE|nr:hypothetical protein I302_01078 [Kwoniella bestiolae CBS 10118]OCF29570.1 hypothetical protein I302_01078 [Kwoniella bestiolae CBS 10118]
MRVSVVVLPIHVFHPNSLPADMWLEHHSLQTELRGVILPIPAAPKAQRRWSAPFQAVLTALTPPASPQITIHSPSWGFAANADRRKLHQSRHSISCLPTSSSTHPFSAYRPPYHPSPLPPQTPTDYSYAQPYWSLYAVSEEEESIATRTSRHLRETSKHRARTVSPKQYEAQMPPTSFNVQPGHTPLGLTSPVVPKTSPILGSNEDTPCRPISINGPRPQTSRTPSAPLSDSQPHLITIPATNFSATSEILSPQPIIFTNPDSYFDGNLATSPESSPSQSGSHRLGRDTVKSLEAMVIDNEEGAAIGSESRESTLGSVDEIVGDKFESDEGVNRPNEVEETRSRSITGGPAQVEFASKDEDRGVRLTPLFTAQTPSETSPTPTALLDAKLDPNKSARGGRGGRVTSARQLFENNNNSCQAPSKISPVVDRKKRRSLPPNMLLTNSHRASTGLVQLSTARESNVDAMDAGLAQERRLGSRATSASGFSEAAAAAGKLRGLIDWYESVSFSR